MIKQAKKRIRIDLESMIMWRLLPQEKIKIIAAMFFIYKYNFIIFVYNFYLTVGWAMMRIVLYDLFRQARRHKPSEG